MNTESNQNFEQAPGAGYTSNDLRGSEQGEGRGYDQMATTQNDEGMGGGHGAHGSGVAGGYEGNSASGQQAAPGGEKQDWLDKGIEAAGKKFGVNVSDANADKAGDLANKQFNQYEGRGLPGVQ